MKKVKNKNEEKEEKDIWIHNRVTSDDLNQLFDIIRKKLDDTSPHFIDVRIAKKDKDEDRNYETIYKMQIDIHPLWQDCIFF